MEKFNKKFNKFNKKFNKKDKDWCTTMFITIC